MAQERLSLAFPGILDETIRVAKGETRKMPQATVKRYDSLTKTGSLLADDGETTWELDDQALDGSMFRFLRPGQRVTFDLVDDKPRNLRIGIV